MSSNIARYERTAIPFLFLPSQPYTSLNEIIDWIGRHYVEIPGEMAKKIEEFGSKWESGLSQQELQRAMLFPPEPKLANIYRRGVAAGQLFMALAELEDSDPIWQRNWPGTNQAIRLRPDERVRALSALELIAQDARVRYWDILNGELEFNPAIRISYPSTFSEADRQWLDALCFETKKIFVFLDADLAEGEVRVPRPPTQADTGVRNESQPAPSRIVQPTKERRNSLDTVIEEAIRRAGGRLKVADVWKYLKELAQEETLPFTGNVSADGKLEYKLDEYKLDKNGEKTLVDYLSRDGLDSRLRRRREKAIPMNPMLTGEIKGAVGTSE
ncbi:hypothetical protein [Paraburkholderia sp. GAS32]|uniref:hypothetical protein n=1 Tax=Paraburkholderia sp. GAS32 TaxID=3035129 RepID=UPI003D1AB0C3